MCFSDGLRSIVRPSEKGFAALIFQVVVGVGSVRIMFACVDDAATHGLLQPAECFSDGLDFILRPSEKRFAKRVRNGACVQAV